MTYFQAARILIATAAFALISGGCGDSAGPTTPASPLDLRPDGIGSVEVGQTPEAVMSELNSFFGEPDVDSGWIDANSPLYGACPGLAMRALGWGSLYLFFVSDDPSNPGVLDDAGRWYSYSYGYDFSRNEGQTDPRNLELQTEAGVGLGTTRTALRSAYPDVSESYNAAADTWTFVAPIEGAELRGLLDGPTEDAEVALIETSPGCELG